jgi:hypothetical protein
MAPTPAAALGLVASQTFKDGLVWLRYRFEK